MATNGKARVVRLDSYRVGDFEDVPVRFVSGILVKVCEDLWDQGVAVGDRVVVSMAVYDGGRPHVRVVSEDGDDFCAWLPRTRRTMNEWFELYSDDITVAVPVTTASTNLVRMIGVIDEYLRISASAGEEE